MIFDMNKQARRQGLNELCADGKVGITCSSGGNRRAQRGNHFVSSSNQKKKATLGRGIEHAIIAVRTKDDQAIC